MSKRAVVDRLEEHPNLPEVLGVLAQLAHIDDDALTRLAAGWRNTVAVAAARDTALSPDSPLVCEVLAAFDALSALFADDLAGEAPYLVVPAGVAVTALKAVRDAIAAAYARPVLTRVQHAALMAPWRAVYPRPTVDEPDLGPESDQVKALLGLMPLLAGRCHDSSGQALFDALVDRSFADESARADALETAFQAAVLTSRRRVWALVRRSGAEGLSRPCTSCRRGPGPVDRGDRESQRVMALCLDAACALLVADTLPDATTAVLTTPVTELVPLQRRPGAAG
ncbi:MAG TPA: hypothetical protein VM433_10720 [Mycobacteriales bacterium]|nr:hypothetical protein [Mycobacteriales bacterium]